MEWSYQREESEGFKPIPEGKHRIRVRSAETAVSSKGNDILVLQFDVSGYSSILYHYITFIKDKPEITNRMLTQFFDSFKDIPEGSLDMSSWIGKVGACVVKQDEYNGKASAKLNYFIRADKQGDLPPWKEPEKNDDSGSGGDGFMNIPDEISDQVPFF